VLERRVVKLGKNGHRGYRVNVPIEWVRERGLKLDDDVLAYTDEAGRLVIEPVKREGAA
jgi:bifunctional DNA-binding transcriptional regulator/antitoxin component of YhaV-PrlF toxin-antitoxin module